MSAPTIPATTIVPLISGRVRGPLGIGHLPRLWLKLRLRALGRLPAGYRCGDGGSDSAVLDAIGVDADALIAFVSERAPDHQAFEAWIREHATTLTSPAVEEHTRSLDTSDMPQPRRDEWCARFGVPGYTVATRLNELDDWELTHAQIVAGDVATPFVIPAISSSVAGPIGIAHLARFWLKKILKFHDRLPADYRSGEGGFDGWLLEELGISDADVDAFVAARVPDYLTFEAWVRERTTATPETIAAFNAELLGFPMPEKMATARRALYGLPDTVTVGVMLNDIDDWGGLHDQLIALR